MAVKVDSTLKKEDVKEGDVLKSRQNHLLMLYVVVSDKEFFKNVGSKFNRESTMQAYNRGEILFLRVNGEYTIIPPNIFYKSDIVENLEEELGLVRGLYQQEIERLQILADANISMLERIIRERAQPPSFELVEVGDNNKSA
ncbi:hypothetical protein HYX17_00985 [Candidatus Woesearchaeota archaeon]|nr:hypothetical protein [Candidatus Woesearchaeota archaeon]